MLPSNEKTVPMINETMTAAGTSIGTTIDTLGFDYLKIDLAIESASAAETALTTLRVCESDTDSAMTAYTDGTPVTAFVGAAAVSTSAGFVLPARSSTKENTYRMNIDLKGRKRYLALNVAPTLTGTNGGAVVAIGTLGRAQDGADVKTVATTVAGMRLIVNG
jgi:hypothetical protein